MIAGGWFHHPVVEAGKFFHFPTADVPGLPESAFDKLLSLKKRHRMYPTVMLMMMVFQSER